MTYLLPRGILCTAVVVFLTVFLLQACGEDEVLQWHVQDLGEICIFFSSEVLKCLMPHHTK